MPAYAEGDERTTPVIGKNLPKIVNADDCTRGLTLLPEVFLRVARAVSSLNFESMMMVTGPSVTNSTCMSASLTFRLEIHATNKKVRKLSLPDIVKLIGFAVYVRAAGFLAAWSKMVFKTLFGTCSNVNGSIEYEARPFDSDRMAVA